jgi:anti-sigma B factor antagonist
LAGNPLVAACGAGAYGRLKGHRLSTPTFDDLTLSARYVGATLVVAASGCLDLDTAPGLERRLRALEPLPDIVALDLADVPFVDAAGLRVLLAEHDRAQAEGRRVVLMGVHGSVLTAMRVTGVDGALPVALAFER